MVLELLFNTSLVPSRGAQLDRQTRRLFSASLVTSFLGAGTGQGCSELTQRSVHTLLGIGSRTGGARLWSRADALLTQPAPGGGHFKGEWQVSSSVFSVVFGY